jgi:ABC-type branched-subunit amino acid transport system substrate-binding protein
MSKRITSSLAWLIALGLLLSAGSLAHSAQTDTRPRFEVRIGSLLLPNSEGDLAAQLAVSELNQLAFENPDGFVYSFRLTYPDSYPRTADDLPRALSELQQQQVSAILGPADNALALPNLEPLARVGVPVLTLSTSDTLTDIDVTNNILRLRAAEGFYSRAAADYMLTSLGLTNIALVQTDIASTEALIAFDVALADAGRQAAIKIQLEDGSALPANLDALLAATPDGVALWGSPQDATLLYNELLLRGWTGRFFYRYAQEAAVLDQLLVSNPQGIIGANGWSFAMPDALSQQLLVNYSRRYATLPGDEAAAAYDAIYVLGGQIRVVGPAMPALYESFAAMPDVLAVQGNFAPQTFANGDISRSVTVYELSQYGAPQAVARYENNLSRPEALQADPNLNAIAVIGTPTFTPSPSPSPTQTAIPSATPAQAQVRAIIEGVQVYSGAGDFYESLGVLANGSVATIVGGNADLSWFVIQYRGGIGWLANNPTSISTFDPGGLLAQLPIIDPPPTPLGGVTPTPAVEVADIVIDNVLLSPAQLTPGQPFVANVILRNAGSVSTGVFTIATSFQPGAVYSSNVVQNIEPNASLTVPLSATLAGSGAFTVDVVADTTNAVNEGATGESNNIFRLSYRIDFPLLTQSVGVAIAGGSTIDLAGGRPDLNWTGSSLEAINGAQLGIITTVIYENADYSILTSGVVNANLLNDSQVFGGVLIGVRTAEGNYAAVRVDARTGTSLTISYRVYGQ